MGLMSWGEGGGRTYNRMYFLVYKKMGHETAKEGGGGGGSLKRQFKALMRLRQKSFPGTRGSYINLVITSKKFD